MAILDREEYIEQAYFFRALSERLPENIPLQELLQQVSHELLATTRLPMAISFLLGELTHHGVIGPAMVRLAHYFAPFQAYLINEAENERGRFDMRVAVQILHHEAEYRATSPSRQGLFLYQFEAVCRNRLQYDRALAAIAEDPMYDEAWREWILTVRRQIGLVEFSDLVYVRSTYYWIRRREEPDPTKPVLFGEKEGKIALANRRKDPLYFFAALQRQLGYPAVPRLKPVDETPKLLPQLMRRIERLETRLKLMEDEQREGAFDITKFYGPPKNPE